MSDDPATTNRLAGESSPYLLLHRHNPVDWYPWGTEALARARREERPIFLSVGYSTCYWCHVMERESFSDPAVAALMNREFVNVKVDREERPELDEIYMTATQLLTQHGGWPNSVFLTPELKPFFAGTYFPPEDRQGMPGFPTVLNSLAEAWRSRRAEVEEQATSVATALRRYLEIHRETATAPPPAAIATAACDGLERRFDARWGGFGGAPKFPTPSNLFLLHELAGERPAAARMLESTLDQMARGGIHDQLAGGFHRYATDREWRIPHFEKMLYDNGLLLELYAREWRRTGDPERRRIALKTAAFLGREMTSSEGAFWSAIDAETGGHEGAYYVWTRDELHEVLGDESFGFLAPIYGFDVAPFFEGGHYVLHLPAPLDEQGRRRRMGTDDLLAQIAPLAARLLAARDARPRPATDDKVLTDWNGMAVAGMAVAGRLLDAPDLVERAARAADFILRELRPAGRPLAHGWRQGRRSVDAFLADYAFFIRGLLALDRATDDGRWLAAAVELAEEQAARLGDPAGGFFVAAESDDVLFRSKEVFDGAVPGANAVAVLNLLRLAERTGQQRWLDGAGAALKAFASVAEHSPEAVKTLALAARRYHAAREAVGPVGEGGMDRIAPSETAGSSEAARDRAGDARAATSGPLAPADAEGGERAQATEDVVTAHLELAAPGPDGWRPFRLRVAIAPGWHVYAHKAAGDFLRPTALEGRGVELRNLEYPSGDLRRLAAAGEEVTVYAGTVEIRGDAGPAAADSAALVLSCQPCDDRRCLEPRRIEISL